LQSALGHLNDVASAAELSNRLKSVGDLGQQAELGSAAGKVIGWHARDLREFEPRLRKDWRKFVETPAFWAPAG